MPIKLLIRFTWKGSHRKELIGTCLRTNFSPEHIMGLTDILNDTHWFEEKVSLEFFFNNKTLQHMLHCKPEYIKHIACFFQHLGKDFYITADHGKGYMAMVAKHLKYNGKRCTGPQLNRFCTEVSSNKKKKPQVSALVDLNYAKVKAMRGVEP